MLSARREKVDQIRNYGLITGWDNADIRKFLLDTIDVLNTELITQKERYEDLQEDKQRMGGYTKREPWYKRLFS